jgi:hypothetical protein
MTYFSRLAHRFGSASPRATPKSDARAHAAGGASDLTALESVTEVPALDAPAARAQPIAEPPMASEHAAPTPFAAMPAAAPDERLGPQDSLVAPSSGPHDVARETTAPSPREWMALDSPPAPEPLPRARQSTALRDPQEFVDEVDAMKAGPTASDPSRRAVTASRAQSSQLVAVEPAIDTADSEIEVLPRAESRLTTKTNKPRVGSEPAAQESSRLRLPRPLAETDGDIGPPRLRAAATRRRNDRDTPAGPHDRGSRAALGGPGSTRGSSVEVRIGAVTLQVHAPPPALPQARASFAPYRHYLRMW